MLKKCLLFLSIAISVSVFAMEVTVEYLGPRHDNAPGCKKYRENIQAIEKKIYTFKKTKNLSDDEKKQRANELLQKEGMNPCYSDCKEFLLEAIKPTDSVKSIKERIFSQEGNNKLFAVANQVISCDKFPLRNNKNLFECTDEEACATEDDFLKDKCELKEPLTLSLRK